MTTKEHIAELLSLGSLSVADLAKGTDRPADSVRRCLGELASAGMTSRDIDGKWRLTPSLQEVMATT